MPLVAVFRGRREAGCERMSARMISEMEGRLGGTEDLDWVGFEGIGLRRGVIDCKEEFGEVAWGREGDGTGSADGRGSREPYD